VLASAKQGGRGASHKTVVRIPPERWVELLRGMGPQSKNIS
jgi:hypothetical protein